MAAEKIKARYDALCKQPSDINEHLPTLRDYASRVDSVIEMGVRGVVSTWALLDGLASSGSAGKSLVGVDVVPCAYDVPIGLAKQVGVEARFVQGDSAKVDIPERDLLFIDTWHVYAHLKRELAAHHARTRKYILLHDTTVDAELGESIRCRRDIERQVRESGYPRAEIEKGLWPAVTEFLEAHAGEWELERRFENNNGLTVLRRV